MNSFLLRLSPRTAAISTAIVVAVLCLLTMPRTFGFIDSGEMAAAGATLGIPHPTGYPLLMILGKTATLLIPGRDVLALNIFAALLVGAGAGLLTLLFSDLLSRVETGTNEGEDRGKKGAGITVVYAVFGALLTAMTPVWWGQGTGFEAYALHALLLPLVILTFLRYVDSEEHRNGSDAASFRITRGAFFFSMVLGLSFANHLTTVILAPALLGWFFYRFGFGGGAWVRLAALVPGFIVGLLPYLYLPIRSAADPPLNWGRPTTFARFFEHVTGVQFREYMFNFSVAGKQLGWYFSSLPGEFAWVGLLLAVVGLVLLVRCCRPIALLTGGIFLTCLLYAGTYAIKEIEPYFMAATLAVGFWAAVGLRQVGKRFGSASALGAGVAAVLLAGTLNWGGVDRHDDTMAEDLCRNVLETLPKDAVLFTTRWDILYSGALYLQNVENVRPDVTLVNVNMLPDRVYLSQTLDKNPVFKKVSERIRAFVNERKMFDMKPETRRARNRAYYTTFYRMVNGIIATCGRPVFVTAEVEGKVGYGWNRVPYGLALRLTPDSAYLPQQPFNYRFSLPARRLEPDVMSASLFYANALLDRSNYEAAHASTVAAGQFAAQAATFDPGIEVQDVPTFPMGNEKYVKDGSRFFKSLQQN